MVGQWTEFAAAMAVFLASHFIPRLGHLRDGLIGLLGRRLYFSAYGVLSIILLGWVIHAAAQAPYIEVWAPANWQRWVPMLTLPAVFVLAAIGIGVETPFTLGGRRTASVSPAPEGRVELSRHPLLIALLFWAAAHLVANGALAHVIMFSVFAGLPLVAIPVFDASARRELGQGTAGLYFSGAPLFSLKPLMQGSWRAKHLRPTLRRAAVGLVLWVGVLHLHEAVIGVSPFPF